MGGRSVGDVVAGGGVILAVRDKRLTAGDHTAKGVDSGVTLITLKVSLTVILKELQRVNYDV